MTILAKNRVGFCSCMKHPICVSATKQKNHFRILMIPTKMSKPKQKYVKKAIKNNNNNWIEIFGFRVSSVECETDRDREKERLWVYKWMALTIHSLDVTQKFGCRCTSHTYTNRIIWNRKYRFWRVESRFASSETSNTHAHTEIHTLTSIFIPPWSNLEPVGRFACRSVQCDDHPN